MTRYSLLLIAVLFALPARADDDVDEGSLWAWTKLDTTMQLTFLAVTTVDWMQTINFTQHPVHSDGRSYEANRILGKQPSRAKVNTLIPLGMLAHTALAVALPKPIRQVWQLSFLYLEVDATRSNYRAGVGLTLPWR